MSIWMDSPSIRKPREWIALAFVIVLLLAAMGVPNLLRSRMAANDSSRVAHERLLKTELANNMYDALPAKAKPAAMIANDRATNSSVTGSAERGSDERRLIRTSSLEMVVQRPAEATEKIRALAEREGGFLVSSEMPGEQDTTGGSVTIRVPAPRFEAVRAEIRKLGLRVETEKIEAQDVTRQYVDQEANLRNLRAEEAQYLGILKRARTVKDTMEVSEKLSEVRGQIEQQQAEFSVLSKQIETVAITVSLRSEAEARVFGLNWRPLYQIKMALRDGLDGVADYASAMTAIVFYLPAVLLWLGTILLGAAVGWKVVRWAGRRVFGWQKTAVAAVPQG